MYHSFLTENCVVLPVDLPVASGVREGSGGRRVEKSMMEGLSATEKRRLVAQYGDLSNDEDDDTYPFLHLL